MRLVHFVVLPSLIAAGCSARNTSARPDASLLQLASVEPRLRVMSFNVQSCVQGLEAVARVIREHRPDVVALQEVDKGTSRSNGLDQARELAHLAGFAHYAHFRAETLFGGDYGVAILSRFPMVETHRYTLPTRRGMEDRAVAHAVLQVGAAQISVYVTHLSHQPRRSALRAEQARFIARLMARDPRPKILAGDLNDTPDSPAVLILRRGLQDAFALAGVGPATTYPLPFPLPDLRLDYVLATRELRPVHSFVARELASDHRPLIADFAFPTGAAPVIAAHP